jgi:hypothetical protein
MLKERFGTAKYGYTFVLRIIYSLSSGASHSAQFALAAMLKAANQGSFKFIDEVSEYGKRAKIMKTMFLDAGFELVYDMDVNEKLADGFYFTIRHPKFNGNDLIYELLCYGISAISLENTGSEHSNGLRACVSQIGLNEMPLLKERLEYFKRDNN